MGKYKFKLEERVKGYCEWQLEHYHSNKQELDTYLKQSMPSSTPQYGNSGGSRGEGESRPTEQLGIKLSTDRYINSLEQSTKAVERVISKLSDNDRRLVELVYWNGGYTIEGAGLKVGYGKSAAYEHINRVLCALALELGLVSI